MVDQNPASPASVAPAAPDPLYANRVKVYPRKVSGRYRTIKWSVLGFCLGLYYVMPWLRWDRGPSAPGQALLVDIAHARAYFFWIEIWPQEVYFLTGLLILGAVALFLATALFGRVWCGYTCPQTVWTDLFMLIERLIEGEGTARIRLDQAPWSAHKLGLKAAKHGAWLLVAAATGGAWIMYFNDAPTMAGQFVHGEAGAGVYFFFALFTATTYLLAGWAREQVCTYMCPWPRFQAAMFDEQTLTVTYRDWRGEPRGHAPHDGNWQGRGDCIDCRRCIAVCPTGIDIRDGQQLECIGCGLCIDACNEIMEKVKRPINLIAFATLAAESAKAEKRPVPAYRLVRPRTIVYAGLLVLVGLVMVTALALRSTVTLTVQQDRNPIFVQLSDGAIRNGYTIKISNKTRSALHYHLTIAGLDHALLMAAVDPKDAEPMLDMLVQPDNVGTYHVFVRLPVDRITDSRTAFDFVLADITNVPVARHDTLFSAPSR